MPFARALGGFDEDESHRTLDYFGNKCAYTGAPLREGEVDRDHGIPMNRTHCGIHLFGNVLPATRAANKAKNNRHYRDFVDDPELLAKVELFVERSGYAERVAVLGDLRRYCEAQYRAIVALCGVNESYLAGLLPGRENHPRASEASAKSHASYINTRKPGFEGFQLPDIRRR